MLTNHQMNTRLDLLKADLDSVGLSLETVYSQLNAFQLEIPSWALGTGGTRFGRFPIGGEPRNFLEKVEDVALLKSLNPIIAGLSIHIPWDKPNNIDEVKSVLAKNDLKVGSVNSNTFQDQEGQSHSYKFGSLCHTQQTTRAQAIAHNIECIELGKSLGANTHTIWLADGSNFPGQQDFAKAYQRTLDSIGVIYSALPEDWKLLIEYKPYEPHFYSMVIPDWGTSYALCNTLGNQAKVLVDLGHHLPNTNIEQIVGRLQHFNALGGFHFNSSIYGDDDLTVGSHRPYSLFLIFAELIKKQDQFSTMSWMIDASHNQKDPLEDLLQSCQSILEAYCKALLIDQIKLEDAQENNDVVMAEQIIKNAFLTDVRPLVAAYYQAKNCPIDPIAAYRAKNYRQTLIATRGNNQRATGL